MQLILGVSSVQLGKSKSRPRSVSNYRQKRKEKAKPPLEMLL